MKLVIPVSKWLHGEDDVKKEFPDPENLGYAPGSYLLRPQDKKRCCLGLYLEACGILSQDLYNIGEPCDVPVGIPDEAKWLLGDEEIGNSSKDAGDLMTENDNQARESVITEIFAKHNVEVEFIHDDK